MKTKREITLLPEDSACDNQIISFPNSCHLFDNKSITTKNI